MYVESVRLENIGGFSGQRNVELDLPPGGGWIVLAGRNGSGKSTLLRALALTLVGPSVALKLVSDFSSWVTMPPLAKGRQGHALATVVSDPEMDGQTRRGASEPETWPLDLRWHQPPSGSGFVVPETYHPQPLPNEGAIGGPWAFGRPGWFAAGYGPLRRLSESGPVGGRKSMQTAGAANRMLSLFDETAGLSEGVSWLRELHLLRLEHRPGTESLLRSVLALLSDGLLPDDHEAREVDSDGLWVARRGLKTVFPLRSMSDGYRAVSALVLDLVRQLTLCYGSVTMAWDDDGCRVLEPGVVLIDEVEAHLHVTWQQRIGPWLRAHFPNIQFIVSTHSPYVCQAASPGGLIRMAGPSERRAPEVVDEDLYRRVVYGSGDDAAVSELFGLETPYSERAERKRARLVALESRVLDERATEPELAEYEQLSRDLRSSLRTRVQEVSAASRSSSSRKRS